jgi:hypothetical protein
MWSCCIGAETFYAVLRHFMFALAILVWCCMWAGLAMFIVSTVRYFKQA